MELLGEDPVDAASIAAELRGINSTINSGRSYATVLAETRKTAPIGRALLDVYDAVHDLTVATLASSLQDTEAYKDGARKIVSNLAELRTPDRALEDLEEGG